MTIAFIVMLAMALGRIRQNQPGLMRSLVKRGLSPRAKLGSRCLRRIPGETCIPMARRKADGGI